jgi:hypothetical protein
MIAARNTKATPPTIFVAVDMLDTLNAPVDNVPPAVAELLELLPPPPNMPPRCLLKIPIIPVVMLP